MSAANQTWAKKGCRSVRGERESKGRKDWQKGIAKEMSLKVSCRVSQSSGRPSSAQFPLQYYTTFASKEESERASEPEVASFSTNDLIVMHTKEALPSERANKRKVWLV